MDQPDTVKTPEKTTLPPPSDFTLIKFLIFSVLLVLPFFSFQWGMQYQKTLDSPIKEQTYGITGNKKYESNYLQATPIITITDQTNSKSSCAKNGNGNIEDILVKYTVKKGDTLLSIAKNELGDTSRYQEIAVMNADRYSGLFTSAGIVAQNAFLEVGWELLLPPKWITRSSGQLGIVNGKILTIRPDDGAYEISSRSDKSGHFATITLDEGTIKTNQINYMVGDCISAVRDIRMNKVLKIDLQ